MFKSSLGSLCIFRICLLSLTVSAQSHGNLSIYKLTQVIDTFNHRDTTSFVWIHHFSYDGKARPDTDTWQQLNWKNQLVFTDKLVYSYDELTSRLVTRTGKSQRYSYYYDEAGNLKLITLESHRNGVWNQIEETILTRTALTNEKTKVNIIWNKFFHPPGKPDSVSCYFNIDYILDKNNTVEEKYTHRYQYRNFPRPLVSRFTYDSHPNPLQQITLERFFDWEFDNQGSNNLLLKNSSTGKAYFQQYTYNEMGYPGECIIDKVRTRVYQYDMVQIPVNNRHVENKNSDSKTSFLLYPNPAQTEVTIHSENISNGNAVVRLYAISGAATREIKYTIENNKLDALLSLYGISHGTYLVELVTQKEKRTGKLIIQ